MFDEYKFFPSKPTYKKRNVTSKLKTKIIKVQNSEFNKLKRKETPIDDQFCDECKKKRFSPVETKLKELEQSV